MAIDYKKIQVNLDDGSVWEGELDEFGFLRLTTQIKPPEAPEVTEASPEPTTAEELEKLLEEPPEEAESDYDEDDDDDDYPPLNPNLLKDNAFRARLSSVMLDNKYDRRLKGRTRGKLDMKSLFKVPTQSRSVFTQKESRQGKQYNIVLVVDESSSMRSKGKSVKAAEATVFLAKNFDGLNLNLAVVGFNEIITVRNQFGSSVNYSKLYGDIASMNHDKGGGWNNDYDALNRAYRLFDRAAPGKNMLIMLSDGQPESITDPAYFIEGKQEDGKKYASSLTVDERDEKYHLHHLVNSHKDVTSIGIGILEGGWQIPNHFVVKDINELKSSILTTLKKVIKRG